MRQALAAALLFFASFASAQSGVKQPAPPQTARQALIEMFFGEQPNHFERHLPDVTQHSFGKFGPPGGDNYLSDVSRIAAQIRSGEGKFETFDAGPTLVSATEPNSGDGPDKIEVTMERDDLIGDENQIELALHLSRNGKELALPVIPRFVFSMQSVTDVWRLNEVSVTVRVPLSDPNFLKTLEDDQRTRNEGRAMWSVQQVNTAETGFFKSQGHFACSLALLGKQIGEGESAVTYLDNPQLAKGSVSGYIFAITGCDATHYKIAGEPAFANTGLRAFCSDERGEIRAAANGKATTCLSSGEVAQQAPAEQATGVAVVAPAPSQATGTAAESGNAGAATGAKAQNGAPTVPAQRQAQAVHMTPATADERPGTTGAPQRVRVSAGVMQGLLISEVQPIYPTMGRINVEGPVVLAVVIGKNGAVQSAKITSSPSPLLNSAALDAVRQWKFRPYLLNGKPLEVDTTITVTFTLPKK